MEAICVGGAPPSPAHGLRVDGGIYVLQAPRRKPMPSTYSTALGQLLRADPDMMPGDWYQTLMAHMNHTTDTFPSDFPSKSRCVALSS